MPDTSRKHLLLRVVIWFILGWFALGIQAIRLDRGTTRSRTATRS
jgi:hypothetical protein